MKQSLSYKSILITAFICISTSAFLFAEADEAVAANPVAAIAPQEAITPIDQVRRGQRVTLQGTVHRVTDEDEFILTDGTGQIDIYIGWRNDMPVGEGDKVTVVGMADDDVVPGFRPEIYARTIILPSGDTLDLRTGIRSPKAAIEKTSQQADEKIEVLSTAEKTQAITAIEAVRRGQRVTVQGEVTRIRDEDEFILRDDSGRIRIYIGWRNDMPVEEGDRVTVHGIADDDVLPLMRPEIYARWIALPSGEKITLGGSRSNRYSD
jgi:uncharacterized protein YdeI (BOF family)